ncbi:MAG: hypothetical protein ABI583_12085 [Betaproteobacteria bacterium]
MFHTKVLWMPAPRLAVASFALLIAACAAPPNAPVAVREPSLSVPVAAPPSTAIPAALAARAPSTAANPAILEAVEHKPSPPPAPTAVTAPTPKLAAAPIKAVTPPAATAQVVKAVPVPVTKTAAATLDMKALENRLKQTNSIGFMTKIALKNQVNDLLEQFREYHRGRLNTPLAALRRPYEMLLQKVLALLQDGDPPLANEIVASREAIWGILADPVKFATI